MAFFLIDPLDCKGIGEIFGWCERFTLEGEFARFLCLEMTSCLLSSPLLLLRWSSRGALSLSLSS